MEAAEQVRKFEEFLNLNYEAELVENIRKGHDYLYLDFSKLSMYDPDLANLLLEDPENVLKAAEISVGGFNISRVPENFRIRIFNLNITECVDIRDIRSIHLNKLISVEGVIRQKSDVKPKTRATRFECPSCNNVIPILQLDSKYKEPSGCGCGRKGKFRKLSEELEDVQWMQIEESLDSTIGDRAKKLKLFLAKDLVSPLAEKRTLPGNKIRATGILKKIPVEDKNGTLSTMFDLIFEVNYLEPIEESFEELRISKDDEQKIQELAKTRPFNLMKEALLPDIYGYDLIKKALVMQLFGGVRKERKGHPPLRGDTHILLAGDPGCGKSQMIKRICTIVPKSRYIVMTSSTGVGLTGAVVKDEFTKGYTLEAGALSLANKGLCAIDELDKSEPEETNKLHEAMEQQTISISKANIHETLPAETTILAAANPKEGRFDLLARDISQIDLPTTLKSRFDLIFILKDLPNKAEDEAKADFILSKHSESQEIEVMGNNPFQDIKFFQKYIAYAKLHCRPRLTEGAHKCIKEYYIKMREVIMAPEQRFVAFSITTRQLEALVRLSEAYAKTRLSKTVDPSDAEFAIGVFEECLKQIAIDTDTGKLDIDMINLGTSSSTREKTLVLIDIVRSLEEGNEFKCAPWQSVIDMMKEKGVDHVRTEELIYKLKERGDLIEPRVGYLKLL